MFDDVIQPALLGDNLLCWAQCCTEVPINERKQQCIGSLTPWLQLHLHRDEYIAGGC